MFCRNSCVRSTHTDLDVVEGDAMSRRNASRVTLVGAVIRGFDNGAS